MEIKVQKPTRRLKRLRIYVAWGPAIFHTDDLRSKAPQAGSGQLSVIKFRVSIAIWHFSWNILLPLRLSSTDNMHYFLFQQESVSAHIAESTNTSITIMSSAQWPDLNAIEKLQCSQKKNERHQNQPSNWAEGYWLRNQDSLKTSAESKGWSIPWHAA